jgi:hypothetical protein
MGVPPLQRAEEMRATERGQDELTNNEPAGGVDPPRRGLLDSENSSRPHPRARGKI